MDKYRFYCKLIKLNNYVGAISLNQSQCTKYDLTNTAETGQTVSYLNSN